MKNMLQNQVKPQKSSLKSYVKYVLLSLIIASGLVAEDVYAQRTVIVEPDNYPAEVGALNVAIEGDSTATGERVDENTIYILRKDGVYWLDATITGTGYPIHIEAEEGEGHPPIIRPAVSLTGASSKLFQPRGDFTIKGLYLSHIDGQGALQKNIIRAAGENARIIIDNCWFDYDEQSFVRVDNNNQKIYISNSMGRNIGRNDGSGNGRFIDTRGIPTDSIIIENTTFYNLQGNPLATRGNGLVNYYKFNHNTLVDIAGNFDLSQVIELEFTNNLFTNVGHKGTGYFSSGLTDIGVFRFDSVNEIEGLSDSDRRLYFGYNNFERNIDELQLEGHGFLMGPYRDEIQSIFDSTADTLRNNYPVFDSTATALLEQDILVLQNNIVENESNLNYKDRPSFQKVYEFWEHAIYTPNDIDNYPLMWDNADNRANGSSTADWRNFTYSTSSESYTAAQGGFPLGDLNWFPSKKQEWENTTVSNEEEVLSVKEFNLLQNYPNPFNPTTNITFELNTADVVSIEVFDMLGRRVQEIANDRYAKGSHTVTFTAEGLSSGIYIAQMSTSSGFSKTMKMTLLK